VSELREQALARVATRRKEAFALYIAGLSFETITNQLGYGDPGAARQDVRETLKILRVQQYDDMDEIRTAELARLDKLLATAMDVLDAEHVRPHGTGEDLVEYRDDLPRLAAAKTILAIMERRAKLTGIDAPTRIGVSGAVRYELVGVDPADLT
jgi:hypothetical protein